MIQQAEKKDVSDYKSDVPRISLKQLLKEGRECLIEHRGEDYNLRITRNNKLILTK